jgi:hypothetical protein
MENKGKVDNICTRSLELIDISTLVSIIHENRKAMIQ